MAAMAKRMTKRMGKSVTESDDEEAQSLAPVSSRGVDPYADLTANQILTQSTIASPVLIDARYCVPGSMIRDVSEAGVKNLMDSIMQPLQPPPLLRI